MKNGDEQTYKLLKQDDSAATFDYSLLLHHQTKLVQLSNAYNPFLNSVFVSREQYENS